MRPPGSPPAPWRGPSLPPGAPRSILVAVPRPPPSPGGLRRLLGAVPLPVPGPLPVPAAGRGGPDGPHKAGGGGGGAAVRAGATTMSLVLEAMLGPPGGLRKEPARSMPRSAASSSFSFSSSGFHSWSVPGRSGIAARGGGGGGGSAAASSSATTESLESLEGGEPRARSEKELLQALNERFAGYIERVRALEQRNRALAAEAAALRQQQAGRTAMGELYARELRDMRGALVRLGAEKGQLRLERCRLAEDVAALRGRLEEEARHRAGLEAAARGLEQRSAREERARGPLEERARALREEAELLRKQHRAEVGALLREAPAEPPPASLRPGVTAALRDLRAQLEGTAARSTLQAEEWFRGEQKSPQIPPKKPCPHPPPHRVLRVRAARPEGAPTPGGRRGLPPDLSRSRALL